MVLANPSPEDAEVVALGPLGPEPVEGIVRDVPPIAPLALKCPRPVPFVVPAFGEVACDFAAVVPDGQPRTLAVAAATYGPVGPGWVTDEVDFEDPQLDDRDAQVWVYNKQAGTLGIAQEAGRFAYQVELGPYVYPSVGWYRTQAMLIGFDTRSYVDGFGWLRVVVLPNPHLH